MDQVKLDVYLLFPGQCREAMEFYKGLFGGELTLQTRGEVDPAAPEDMKDKIMHANLVGGLTHLMASDNLDAKASENGMVSLTLSGTDEPKLRQLFNGLSVGGKVGHPLKVEFWGDIFGDVTDKYGINWMISIATKKSN